MAQRLATPSTSTLGDYDILDDLISSASGTVYVGCRPGEDGPGPLLALKALRGSTADALPQLLHSEGHIAARLRLRDPRILTARAVDQTPAGDPMLVMEYPPGISLAELLMNRTLDPERRLRVGLSMLVDATGGLAHMHGASHPGTGRPLHLVHGSLSPHTVWLRKDGVACITDFELASLGAAGGRIRESTEGRVAYAAPAGTADSITADTDDAARDAAADVYSMGAILWRVVSGEVPKAEPQSEDIDTAYPFLAGLEVSTPSMRPLLETARWAMGVGPDAHEATAEELHRRLLAIRDTHGLTLSAEELAALVVTGSEPGALPEHDAAERSVRVPQSRPPASAPLESARKHFRVPSMKETQLGMIPPSSTLGSSPGFDDEVTELWDALVMEDPDEEISHITKAPQRGQQPGQPSRHVHLVETSAAQPIAETRAPSAEADLASVIIREEDLLEDEPAIQPTIAAPPPSRPVGTRSGRGRFPLLPNAEIGWWLGVAGLAVITAVLIILVLRSAAPTP